MRISRLLMVCVWILADGVALAQNAPPGPPAATVARGFHTHDGFFLRVTTGFGSAASVASQSGREVTVSGGGSAGSAAIGMAINPSLVLCAETTSISTFEPTIEVNGATEQFTGGQYQVQYVGVGGSYYLPSNLYLHGGIGAMWLGLKAPGDTEPDWIGAGFAVKGAIGKEWWVSDNWGLGVAAALVIGSVADDPPNSDVDWKTAIFNFSFSATYN